MQQSDQCVCYKKNNIPCESVNVFSSDLPADYSDTAESGIYVNQELIEKYIRYLEYMGLQDGSLNDCRLCLQQLYEGLPEDKYLNHSALVEWKRKLYEADFSWQPVNYRIAAVNGFLKYARRPGLQLELLRHPKEEKDCGLTRKEYLHLLRAARMHVNERLYLLIKVLGCTGIPVKDLQMITVERINGIHGAAEGAVRLPEILRQELQAYALRKNIMTGPVFVTPKGTPVDDSNVRRGIRRLCADAGIEKTKIRSVDFNMLYYQTVTDLQKALGPLAETAYEELLEREEQIIGWNAAVSCRKMEA